MMFCLKGEFKQEKKYQPDHQHQFLPFSDLNALQLLFQVLAVLMQLSHYMFYNQNL